jgi:TRAP-type mannitol/chloroaromatic compound transport system substrate-binding protein
VLLWFWVCHRRQTKRHVHLSLVVKLQSITVPSNFPIFGDATKKFKQLAEAMSNGRLKIRIDSKNKHKSAKPSGMCTCH